MAMIGASCVFVSFLICVQLGEAQYSIPNVVIEVLSPKGLRAYIPDSPEITLFAFQANINSKILSNDVGRISGEITSPTDGKWVFEDLNLQLAVGDVINYYVYVVKDKQGYLKDKLSYTVSAPGAPSKSPVDCKHTLSLVRGVKACGGQILFEDNFDDLREDLWQIEQYIPSEPDFPFVSYQRPFNAPTVSVQDGFLKIEPKFQQDLPGYSNSSIYTGTLDLLYGCTSTSTKCSTQAWGASILPPIASGKLISKTFAFTYGVVEVRAKLPQGNWLYPDILLESLFKKYGVLNYASGVLRIAGALGNDELLAGGEEMGNNVLYGGPIMDFKCRKNLLSRKLSGKRWGEDFHVYSVRWEPERLTFFVDGEEWGRVEPSASGLLGRLRAKAGSGVCDTTSGAGVSYSKMSPFDDHFYISLGLAAGGISEFNDFLTSQGIPKPWLNSGRKATLKFWEDRSSWVPTWKQPALLVDYITVKAL